MKRVCACCLSFVLALLSIVCLSSCSKPNEFFLKSIEIYGVTLSQKTVSDYIDRLDAEALDSDDYVPLLKLFTNIYVSLDDESDSGKLVIKTEKDMMLSLMRVAKTIQNLTGVLILESTMYTDLFLSVANTVAIEIPFDFKTDNKTIVAIPRDNDGEPLDLKAMTNGFVSMSKISGKIDRTSLTVELPILTPDEGESASQWSRIQSYFSYTTAKITFGK